MHQVKCLFLCVEDLFWSVFFDRLSFYYKEQMRSILTHTTEYYHSLLPTGSTVHQWLALMPHSQIRFLISIIIIILTLNKVR